MRETCVFTVSTLMTNLSAISVNGRYPRRSLTASHRVTVADAHSLQRAPPHLTGRPHRSPELFSKHLPLGRRPHHFGSHEPMSPSVGRCNTPARGGVRRVGMAAGAAGAAGPVLGVDPQGVDEHG